MAMSRILAQTWPRSSLCPPTAIFSRHRSNKTQHAQLIEVEIEQSSSSQTESSEASAEGIALGIKKLEDAIHRIVVRRAAPDWLLFLPGYSYWVPPRASAVQANHHQHPAAGVIEILSKLASSGVVRNQGLPLDLLSEDEHMALTSGKTWPSSAFFIEGTSPIHRFPMVKMEVEIQDNEDQANKPSNSEDREG